MKAALAHHLVAPVEPPANQHKSNGERRSADNHQQRHGVTTDLLSNAPAAIRHGMVIEL
jgi:hypothetical protein